MDHCRETARGMAVLSALRNKIKNYPKSIQLQDTDAALFRGDGRTISRKSVGGGIQRNMIIIVIKS